MSFGRGSGGTDIRAGGQIGSGGIWCPAIVIAMVSKPLIWAKYL